MNANATPTIKLSERMTCQLRFVAKHRVAGHNAVNPTTNALISRGLLETVEIPNPTVGRMSDVQVTAAGWAWLKENLGMDRPADEGRATLAEALELAYPEPAAVSVGTCCGTEFYSSEDWYEHRLTHAVERAVNREIQNSDFFPATDDARSVDSARLPVEQECAEADEEAEGRYPFTVLIGRHATYFRDRKSADSYAAQYSGSIVATECVLSDSPGKPCPNLIVGARYATAGPLPGCAYHLGH